MEAKWQLKWSGMAFKGSKSVSKKVVENRMKNKGRKKEIGAIRVSYWAPGDSPCTPNFGQ